MEAKWLESYAAKLLGGGRRGRLLAAVIAAAIPEGVLEASVPIVPTGRKELSRACCEQSIYSLGSERRRIIARGPPRGLPGSDERDRHNLECFAAG